MAAEAVRRFLEGIETDATLADKVQAALAGAVSPCAAIATVARAEGYDLGEDDVRAALEEMSRELNEDELSHVAGGVSDSVGTLHSGAMISPRLFNMVKTTY